MKTRAFVIILAMALAACGGDLADQADLAVSSVDVTPAAYAASDPPAALPGEPQTRLERVGGWTKERKIVTASE